MTAVTITRVSSALWGVHRGAEFCAALRWSGQHMIMVSPDGDELGTLYRSDGKIIAGETVYTWRAYAPGPGGREVARRASQEEACERVLRAHADNAAAARRVAEDNGPWVGTNTSGAVIAQFPHRAAADTALSRRQVASVYPKPGAVS